MKKTGIFYGSTNGDTESVANRRYNAPCRTTLRSIVIRLFDLGSRGNAGRLE